MNAKVAWTLFCWLAATTGANAQALEKQMPELAINLSKTLVSQGGKNVAAIDFTDLQGQPTELGRFLSERLSVEMVLAGGVSVLDRANIKSILAEHKLTEAGLVNPANAKKLGAFAGVDTILIGTVTSLDATFVLTVKAIATESAKIVAAGTISFPKTPDLQAIGNKGLPGNAATSGGPTAGGSAGYQEASAIATKDLGPLRVTLKSATATKLRGPYGQINGIRVSLEFTSRDIQNVIVIGVNATQERGYNRGACTLGQGGLRASVVDSGGAHYRLPNANLSGVSIIGVGCEDMTGYDPSQVASLLERMDREGPRDQQRGGYVYGSLSTISPGQSISVVMTFAADGSQIPPGPPPTAVQIDSEIVIGTMVGQKKSYSLQNLAFDRVSLATGDLR